MSIPVSRCFTPKNGHSSWRVPISSALRRNWCIHAISPTPITASASPAAAATTPTDSSAPATPRLMCCARAPSAHASGSSMPNRPIWSAPTATTSIRPPISAHWSHTAAAAITTTPWSILTASGRKAVIPCWHSLCIPTPKTHSAIRHCRSPVTLIWSIMSTVIAKNPSISENAGTTRDSAPTWALSVRSITNAGSSADRTAGTRKTISSTKYRSTATGTSPISSPLTG